jgi:hypothetical protein
MSTVSVATSYRGLFAEPALRRLAVADVCARLPQGMVSITLLLVAALHASMTVAGPWRPWRPAAPSSPWLSPLPSPSRPRPPPPSPGMHDNQGRHRASFGTKERQRRGGPGP